MSYVAQLLFFLFLFYIIYMHLVWNFYKKKYLLINPGQAGALLFFIIPTINYTRSLVVKYLLNPGALLAQKKGWHQKTKTKNVLRLFARLMIRPC